MRSRWRAPKIVFFLLLLGSADSQVQKLRVTGKDSPVKGLVGEDVTLPCLLSGVRTPLNLLVVRVLWKLKSPDGAERQVYHFESFKHSPSRSGSHMADSDLVQGNFSLYIPHVQISDDGDYICSVLVSPDDGSAKFPLHVSVKPQTALPRFVSIDLSHENSLTVSCDASMFYPETITIRWVKYSRSSGTNSSLDRDTCARLPSRNSDGTFNVTSTVIVSPSSIGEDGDKYFCVVSHRSLDEKTALTFILSVSETKMTVGTMIAIVIIVILSIPLMLLSLILYMRRLKKEKPRLSWIMKDDRVFHKEKATLFCQITGFRPKKLTINLFLEMPNSENETNHKDLIHSWKSTDHDPSSTNSFTAPESLTAGGRNAKASAIIPLMEIGLERSLLLSVFCLIVSAYEMLSAPYCACAVRSRRSFGKTLEEVAPLSKRT
ncbi:natural cytotoxicity triggering receptor 3 ligand 1-like [Lithobates pipiens]